MGHDIGSCLRGRTWSARPCADRLAHSVGADQSTSAKAITSACTDGRAVLWSPHDPGTRAARAVSAESTGPAGGRVTHRFVEGGRADWPHEGSVGHMKHVIEGSAPGSDASSSGHGLEATPALPGMGRGELVRDVGTVEEVSEPGAPRPGALASGWSVWVNVSSDIEGTITRDRARLALLGSRSAT